MKILVLVLIIPFVPFLLVIIKIRQSSSFIRTWFSALISLSEEQIKELKKQGVFEENA